MKNATTAKQTQAGSPVLDGAASTETKTMNATLLDGNPYMVAEKDGIRVLWLGDKVAELKTCPAHFCGPIFVSRESGERKITELKRRLPHFEFELVTRETFPFTFKVLSGVEIRTRKQIAQ